jgi:cation:H+ antiporter
VPENIFWFVLGGALLIAGAEVLVRGASRLATAAGIAPLVIGLTVVSYGTGAPELAVTVGAAYDGQPDLALGNVVGSNICNVLLILGLSALITPLIVSRQLVRLDIPLMIGASGLLVLLGLDRRIGRLDGSLLFAGAIAYTAFLIVQGRKDREPADASTGPSSARQSRWWINVGLILSGLGLLALGARWLVQAAVDTATALGVTELVIGLTIVAVGTSLPEVATSVLAALRGQRDIAVGNVVGSNIFNILVVLGLGSLVAPQGIPVPESALTFDLPVMTAVALAALPIFFTGFVINRWEGAVFLAYYLAYVAYLILAATAHHARDEFAAAMGYFVLPLTALTLAVVSYRALRGKPTTATPSNSRGASGVETQPRR